ASSSALREVPRAFSASARAVGWPLNSWRAFARGSRFCLASAARRERNPSKPSFLAIFTSMALETWVSSATILSNVLSSMVHCLKTTEMTRASSAVKVENRWRRQWSTDFPLSVSTAASSILKGGGSAFVLYRFFKAVDLSEFHRRRSHKGKGTLRCPTRNGVIFLG